MKHKLFFYAVTLLMAISGTLFAETISVDGIRYETISDTEVEVVRNSYFYSGHITIPANVSFNNINYSVTGIGDYAFDGCTSLTSIEIPSSVTSIGSKAFRDCTSLTSINIPSSVTSIGSSAFRDCSSLASINIPSGVTSIGDFAFKGCTRITSIDIPSGVTSIGYSAFYNCSSLASINIPSGVTSIGSEAFRDCTSLTSIEIPSSVTSIGSEAFRGCTSLTSINIPASVTSIGSYAFSDCNIKNVKVEFTDWSTNSILHRYLPNSAAWKYYKNGQELIDVVIPDSVTAIGSYALYNGKSIASVTIPSSVTSIGSSAFDGCSNLTSIEIPSSVTSIGESAFKECNIKNVKVEFTGWSTNSILHSYLPSNAAWKYYKNGQELIDVVIPDSVTAIVSYALYNGKNIVSVSIPSSVTSIGNYAFYNCTSLTSIDIPSSVTSIGRYAFYNCTGNLTVNCNIKSASSYSSDGWFYGSDFKRVEIGKNVTSIGSYAFYGNNQIRSLTIGSGVTSIGSNAFSTTPTKVYWLTNTPPSGYDVAKGVVNYVSNDNYPELPNTMVYPYLSSMFETDGVRYVPVNPSERTCDALDCTYAKKDSVINIGETVVYRNIDMTVGTLNQYISYNNPYIKMLNVSAKGDIGENAFRNCSILQMATIGNEGNIGNSAFEGCSALQTATISNAGNIGTNAFYNCSKLSTCIVGDNVTAIQDSAFLHCSSLPTIQLGKNIKTIGKFAFAGCSKLKEIAIPDATTSLGNNCFGGCVSLETASTGNGITEIQKELFYNCPALKAITIGESVKSIGQYSFGKCSALADIAIPSNVTKIDDYAFSQCSALADIIIADRKEALALGYNGLGKPLFNDCPLDSLYIGGKISYNTSDSVGYSPFYRNTKLRSVVIANAETEIYPNEFYGCTGLKNVKIGDGVKKFGDYAFSGCSSLVSFTFGAGVESIGKEAFSDCTALTTLGTKAAVPPTCGAQALEDINKWDCTLYVPQASTAVYQGADQWKDFFFVATIEGSELGGDEGFEGIHRIISDGVTFINTLTRDYDTVTYVRNYETYNWEAVYLPFSMNYDEWKDDYEVARVNAFYQYDDDEDGDIDRSVLQAIKVKSGEMNTNTPYLIRAKVPGEKALDLLNKTVHTSKTNTLDCSTVDTKFTFAGVFANVPGASLNGKRAYAMENGVLKAISAEMTVPACRWYIEVENRTLNSPFDAPVMRVLVSETEESAETDIQNFEAQAIESSTLYDLEGRHVNQESGFYVKQGKKYIRK